MPNAKIEIRVGGVSFAGEGEEKWLAAQLDKLLMKAAELSSVGGTELADEGGEAQAPNSKTKKVLGLAQFLSAKNVGSNQNKRFLATAEWFKQKGQTRITTGDVSKALKDAHQKKLGNPSECLSQNVSKGFCEKDGGKFFVTDDGSASLD